MRQLTTYACVFSVGAVTWSCWGTTHIIQWNSNAFRCPNGTFESQADTIDAGAVGPGIAGGSNLSFGPQPAFCNSATDVNRSARCWDQTSVVNPEASAPGCEYATGPLPTSSCGLAEDAGGVEVIFLCEDEQVP